MLIFVSALNIEARNIIKKLKLNLIDKKNNRQTVFFKNNVYVVITGIGWKNVKKMLNYFFSKYDVSIDDKFILIGIAGAVDKNLNIGDIIIPGIIKSNEKTVKIYENSRILYDDNKPFFKKEKVLLKEKNPQVTAVDMESFQFISIMKQYNIKYYRVIKAISDTAETELPEFEYFNAKLSDIGLKNYFRVIGFKYNMNKALQKLSKYLFENIIQRK